jgi:hypothetical protein
MTHDELKAVYENAPGKGACFNFVSGDVCGGQ